MAFPYPRAHHPARARRWCGYDSSIGLGIIEWHTLGGAPLRVDATLHQADDPSATGLRGVPLVIAHTIWFVLAVSAWTIAALALPARLTALRTVCATQPCSMLQPSPGYVHALQQLGLSLPAFAGLTIALELATIVAFSLVAVGIVWYRAHDRMAIFSSLVLLTFAVVNDVTFPATQLAPPLRWPAMVVEAFLLASLVPAFYLFPDGHFVPGWTRILGAIWVVWIAASR